MAIYTFAQQLPQSFQANLLVKAGGYMIHISQMEKAGPLVSSSILSSLQGFIDSTVTQ